MEIRIMVVIINIRYRFDENELIVDMIKNINIDSNYRTK